MAFQVNYKTTFILVVIGYLFVATNATSILLETVCNKTRDIDFCLNVFGSDQVTWTTDFLRGLAQIAIDKVTKKTTKTRTDVLKQSFFVSNPKVKDVFIQCVHEYNDTLTALRIAPIDLRESRYADLYQHASDAAWGAVACKRGFIVKSLSSPLKN